MAIVILILAGAATGWFIAARSDGRIAMVPAIALGAIGAVAGGLLLGLVFAAIGLILRLVAGLICAVLLIGAFASLTRGR